MTVYVVIEKSYFPNSFGGPASVSYRIADVVSCEKEANNYKSDGWTDYEVESFEVGTENDYDNISEETLNLILSGLHKRTILYDQKNRYFYIKASNGRFIIIKLEKDNTISFSDIYRPTIEVTLLVGYFFKYRQWDLED